MRPVTNRSRRPSFTAKLRFENLESRLNPATGVGWSDLATIPMSVSNATAYIQPSEYRAINVDPEQVRSALSTIPTEEAWLNGAKPVTFTLPAPDGTLQRFAVLEAVVMAPELAADFPEISVYQGYGLDDPYASLRMDVTPQGFHAQVRTPSGSWYIDPYYHLENQVHISYFKADLKRETVSLNPKGDGAMPDDHQDGEQLAARDDNSGCNCGVCSGVYRAIAESGIKRQYGPLPSASTANRSGTQLRTYRLANAATLEYTNFHGGTQTLGQAAIVTAINRVNDVYEDELSIRLVLVAGNQNLVFTNGTGDSYSNNSGGAMLGQNQTVVDSVIGSANYDIGHVFSTGGGGVAYLQSVGDNSIKAGGVTGSGAPVNDPFVIDYVTHEMGHQFGGNHTFNTSTDGNRNATTAYEPGSGSTIMAYAGITGGDSDLQSNSDPYFHSISFDEIISFVDTIIPGVGTRTATGNLVPTANAGSNFVIPARTPFTLTAPTATDGNGDALTYEWQQRDLGPANLLSSPDNGSSPLFRSFDPTTSPSRTFPNLIDLAANVNTIPKGEKLPTTSWGSMDFRLTVRDNRVGGGAVNTDDMSVQVVNTGTAFAVTAPAPNDTWLVGEQQVVTWDVAGTTAAPINVANVKISLSTDSGLTYPIVLAASVPNNGSATVTVPNNITTDARIKVEAIGNIFFDISNQDFNISNTAPTFQVSGKLFEDWRNNGVVDSYDRGVAGQTILFDTNNNGIQDTPTFNSGNVNIAIPDSPNPAISHTINVTGLPTTLTDVNVRLNIGHSWGSDLRVTLRGPNNVTIPLITNRGGSGTFFSNTVLDDEAASPISSGSGTFTDSFTPEQALSTFDGINPNGNWTLFVQDFAADDTGTLVDWSLTFAGERVVTTNGLGNYNVTGLPNGTYQVRPLLTGYNLVSPAGGTHVVTITSPTDTNPNKDFGVGLQNAIYGLVIADSDSDGVFDAGEPGLSGVTVYRDTNNNGALNGGEPSQATDSLGRYVFTAQATGAAAIRDILTLPQVQTFPVGGVLNLNLPSNGTLFDNNFGITVGTAPIITSNGGGTTATINVDSGFTAVTTVTATDADPNPTLTYSIIGGADSTKFTINPTTGELAFVTAPDFGNPTDANTDNNYLVTVQVYDGVLNDTQAITVAVQPPINDAPVLANTTPSWFTPIPQGIANPSGDTVATVVGTTISDLDTAALEGIAVIAATSSGNGTWEFSTDAGATWMAFGTPSSSAARLLRADDLVRFVPNIGFVGVVSITYHAWDQTSGTAGGTANLTPGGSTGGTTAFSTATNLGKLYVANTLTPVPEDSLKHKGDVASFLLTNVTDADAVAKKGLAVTGYTTGGGVWQHSANGKSWKTMPALSDAYALLLRDTARVRYLPSANETGYALLQYRAWDQTTGKKSTFVDLTTPNAMGGSASVSASTNFVFAQTTDVNDKPTLDAGGVLSLTAVAPTDTDPAGDTITALLKSQVADSDPGALRGIAVTGIGKGVVGQWEYSPDAGVNWASFPAVTAKAALLLRAEDMVRFVPIGSLGQASFSFKAWDQTEGTFGTTTSTVLKTSKAFSTTTELGVVIVGTAGATNNAPVLNTTHNPTLTPVLEDTAKPAGSTAATLIALGTAVADDFGALKGVAITGVSSAAAGRWEWSLNGKSWKPIAPVSDSMALLLRDSDRLRYVPKPNSNVAGTVTFRAWDQTQGGAGGRADLTIAGGTGGNSAFSTASDTATAPVTAVNDQPVLNITTNPVLPSPTSATPTGVTVASFASALISDVDPGALKGIAVTKSAADFGTWEYSVNNGGTWNIFPTFPPLSEAGALLLRSTDLVRLKPFNFGVVGGTASFNFKAWDQSVGTAGFLTSTKGTTAISKAFEVAQTSLDNGNDKPLLNIAPTPFLAHPSGSTVASFVGSTITDADAADQQGIAVTNAVSSAAKGTWQFSLDNGTTWVAMDKVSASNARLLRSTDMIRFVAAPGVVGTQKLMYKAWDQTTGTAGSLSPTKLSAFSAATETAFVNVNAAPEFPSL